MPKALKGILMSTNRRNIIGAGLVGGVDSQAAAMNRSLVPIGEEAHFDSLLGKIDAQVAGIKHQIADVSTILEQYNAQVSEVIAAAKTGSKCKLDTQMRKLNEFVKTHQIGRKVSAHLHKLGQNCLQLLANAQKKLVIATS